MALSVTRSRHSLVRPAEKTPLTMVDLSVMDKIPALRCMARTLHVYSSGHDEGAGRVIREALSRALVPYYPLAGRLIHSASASAAELHVQCCGQGVWFVEAFTPTTLASLNYLEDANSSSIPYDELLPPAYDHQFSESQLDNADDEPLVQMQVTGFACGGFVMGLKFSHTICDGLGAAQFLKAVGELARGFEHPSIPPLWHRHFIASSTSTGLQRQNINAAHKPSVLPNCNYRLEQTNIDIPIDKINKVKQEFQESAGGHRRCSVFEIVAASFWKCRTKAITKADDNNYEDRVMTLVFFANCRHLMEPPLPEGFYGNCFFPVVVKAARDWLAGASTSIVDVVKLVQEAKAELPNQVAKYLENMKTNRSDADSDPQEDPFAPHLGYNTLFLSEWGRLGFNQVDFGWGPPLHVVPIQGSSFIPAGIMGFLPSPHKGVRLMTWCVEEPHRLPFIHHITKL